MSRMYFSLSLGPSFALASSINSAGAGNHFDWCSHSSHASKIVSAEYWLKTSIIVSVQTAALKPCMLGALQHWTILTNALSNSRRSGFTMQDLIASRLSVNGPSGSLTMSPDLVWLARIQNSGSLCFGKFAHKVAKQSVISAS